MKRNVDLTENLMFHNMSSGVNNVAEGVDLILKLAGTRLKAPWNWDIGEEVLSLDTRENEPVVLTGNKEDRASKKYVRRWETGKYCDCCGKLISKKPWVIRYSLCNSCDDRLEEKPWFIRN